MGMSSKII